MQSNSYASKTAQELSHEVENAARNKQTTNLFSAVSPDIGNPNYPTSMAVVRLASQNETDSVDFLLGHGASTARAAGGFAQGGYDEQAYVYLEKAKQESPGEYLFAIQTMLTAFIRRGEQKKTEELLNRLKNEFPDTNRHFEGLTRIGCSIARYRPEELDSFLNKIKEENYSPDQTFKILDGVMMGLARGDHQAWIDSFLENCHTEYAIEPVRFYDALIRGFSQTRNVEKAMQYLTPDRSDWESVFWAVVGGQEEWAKTYTGQQNLERQINLYQAMSCGFAHIGHVPKAFEYIQLAGKCSAYYHEVALAWLISGRLPQQGKPEINWKQVAYLFALGHHQPQPIVGLMAYDGVHAGLLQGYSELGLWPTLDALLHHHDPSSTNPARMRGLVDGGYMKEAYRLLSEEKNSYHRFTLLGIILQRDQTPRVYHEISKVLASELPENRDKALVYYGGISLSPEKLNYVMEKVNRNYPVMDQWKMTYDQAEGWFKPEVWFYLLQFVQLTNPQRKNNLTPEIFHQIGSFLAPMTWSELLSLAGNMSAAISKPYKFTAPWIENNLNDAVDYTSKTADELCEEFCDAAVNQNKDKMKALLQIAMPDIYGYKYGDSAIFLLASAGKTDAVEFLLSYGASIANAAGGAAYGRHDKEAFQYLDRAKQESKGQYLYAIELMLYSFARRGDEKQTQKLLERWDEASDDPVSAVGKIGYSIAYHRPDVLYSFLDKMKEKNYSKEQISQILGKVIVGLARKNQQARIDLYLKRWEAEYNISPDHFYNPIIRGNFLAGNIRGGMDYLNLKRGNLFGANFSEYVYQIILGGGEKYLKNLEKQNLQAMISAFACIGHLSKVYEYLDSTAGRGVEPLLHSAAINFASAGHQPISGYNVFSKALEKIAPGNRLYISKIWMGLIFGYAQRGLFKNVNELLEWPPQKEWKNTNILSCLQIQRVKGLLQGKDFTEAYRLIEEVRIDETNKIDQAKKIAEEKKIDGPRPDRSLTEALLKTILESDRTFVTNQMTITKDDRSRAYNQVTKTLVLDIEPKLRRAFLKKIDPNQKCTKKLIDRASRYSSVMKKQEITYDQAEGWFKPEVWFYLLKCEQLHSRLKPDAFILIGRFLAPVTPPELVDLAGKMSIRAKTAENSFTFFAQKKPNGASKRKKTEEPTHSAVVKRRGKKIGNVHA